MKQLCIFGALQAHLRTGVRHIPITSMYLACICSILWLGCADDVSESALPLDSSLSTDAEADSTGAGQDALLTDSRTAPSEDVSEGDDERVLRLRAFCPKDAEAIEARIDALLDQLTLEEKVALMSGTEGFPADGVYPTGAVERLGLPGLRMVDGPRGVSKNTGVATAFPVAMARGSTSDS